MDVDVETGLLYGLIDGLQQSSQVLYDASNDMSSYTHAASASLSGNQYSLSVEETDRVCECVGEAVNNMSTLCKYISNLAQYVEQYLQCKYNEE